MAVDFEEISFDQADPDASGVVPMLFHGDDAVSA
jgi:hypothetical protein